jgi:competence protein ComEC
MQTFHSKQIRTPLLYLLISLIAGLIFSKEFVASPLSLIFLASPFLATCLFLAYTGKCPRIWIFSYFLASTLSFWAYGELRAPPQPDQSYSNLPPREAVLTFKIQQNIHENLLYQTSSGFAKVVQSSVTSKIQPGTSIYYQQDLSEPDTTPAQKGETIRATGILDPIQSTPGKSDFNFDAYLIENGIHYRFERTSRWTLISPNNLYQKMLTSAFHKMDNTLRLGGPADTGLANIYTAMLLGQKDALSDEQNTRYQRSGTMHFFAISGLHIGVIAAVIAQALRLIRIPRRISPWIGLPLLLLYVQVTGSAPSAIRAFLMAAFFWASYALQRQRNPMGALIASAVGVLLIDPQQLWQVGFQLSYAVVLSILLFGLPLASFIKNKLNPYRYLPESDYSTRQKLTLSLIDKGALLFAISLSAWLASAPLCAAIFGFLAPIAILLNIVLVNLVAITICTGVLSLTFGLLGLSPIASFLNHAAWLVIDMIDYFVDIGLKVPYATLNTDAFPRNIGYIWLLAYLSGLLLLHSYLKARKSISQNAN